MTNSIYHPQTNIDQYCKEAFKLHFAEYCDYNRQHIKRIREKVNLPADARTVDWNCPFEWKPKNYDGKRAVLLIHGFMASPHIMRSIGEWYLKQGFLVRAILLPGHGTCPGDLLETHLKHWMQAVHYGIRGLMSKAKELHLCGFSLGGNLALIASYEYPIKSLFILAPALGVSKLTRIIPWLGKLSKTPLLPFLRWTMKSQQDNLVAYCSFPLYGAGHIYKLLKQLWRTAKRNPLETPCFLVGSADDVTVKIQPIVEYFKLITPKKALYLFSKRPKRYENIAGATVANVADEAKRILDMSHVAMPVAPTDEYLGEYGFYYQKSSLKPYYGEVSPENVMTHQPFRRLTYNPNFNNMLTAFEKFLKSV